MRLAKLGGFMLLALAAAAALVIGLQRASAHVHGDSAHSAQDGTPAAAASAYSGDPYPLGTCPVMGEELGGMGEPVSHVHAGREIRFCCPPCIKSFEKDPEKYLREIDAQIVAQQLAHYPLDTCIVAGGELGGMGAPVNAVAGNRLFRLCCAGCTAALEDDPAGYIAQLDAAAADAQRASYPLSNCIVMPEHELDAESAVEHVVGGRLFRLCCTGCIDELQANPAKFIALLDAAAQ